ncbi:HNH endonuclease [Variovorax paradoxus]|nr:HNH endonuclease [Variovorax paradoxus]
MKPQVLQLDIQGTPQAWISLEQAASHYATGSVVWEDGEGPLATMRGGFNVARGVQSRFDISPIIALKGCAKVNLFDHAPAFSRRKLFVRDRHTCAYCAQRFREADLTVEHILPESRGGAWDFMNCVSACRACNSLKAARTPEEAGMKLVYLPYVPSRWEDFLLEGRNVRADVHEWLTSRLPKGSRLN